MCFIKKLGCTKPWDLMWEEKNECFYIFLLGLFWLVRTRLWSNQYWLSIFKMEYSQFIVGMFFKLSSALLSRACSNLLSMIHTVWNVFITQVMVPNLGLLKTTKHVSTIFDSLINWLPFVYITSNDLWHFSLSLSQMN